MIRDLDAIEDLGRITTEEADNAAAAYEGRRFLQYYPNNTNLNTNAEVDSVHQHDPMMSDMDTDSASLDGGVLNYTSVAAMSHRGDTITIGTQLGAIATLTLTVDPALPLGFDIDLKLWFSTQTDASTEASNKVRVTSISTSETLTLTLDEESFMRVYDNETYVYIYMYFYLYFYMCILYLYMSSFEWLVEIPRIHRSYRSSPPSIYNLVVLC